MPRVILAIFTVTAIAVYFLFAPLGSYSYGSNEDSNLFQSLNNIKKQVAATEKTVEKLEKKVNEIENNY